MLFNLLEFFKKLYNSFLNLVYEKKCLICGCSKTDKLLCKTCLKNVQFLSSFPHRIFKNIPIYSVTLYQDSIKELIIKLKFKHNKSASVVLAELIFNYFNKIKEQNKDYIICYVPGFYLKSIKRGYSHTCLIAKEFSKLTDINICKDLIKKIKYTTPQYKTKNRKENIKGSFKINTSKLETVQNKTIILLDDITTSGATLEEIINCLLEYEIKDIICLTAAKAG